MKQDRLLSNSIAADKTHVELGSELVSNRIIVLRGPYVVPVF